MLIKIVVHRTWGLVDDQGNIGLHELGTSGKSAWCASSSMNASFVQEIAPSILGSREGADSSRDRQDQFQLKNCQETD